MRRAEPKTVVLRTLQRSIFTFPDYNPPLTAQGEHILKFTNRSGELPVRGVLIETDPRRCNSLCADHLRTGRLSLMPFPYDLCLMHYDDTTLVMSTI